MEGINALLKGFESLQTDLDEITLKAVKTNEKQVLDLNRDQMQSGIKSDGQPIKPEYTRRTKSIKKSKGQPIDRVTLKDTGDFHNSVFASYSANSFMILASDQKTTKLKQKYGRDILGLTDQNIDKTANIIKNDVSKELKKRLNALT